MFIFTPDMDCTSTHLSYKLTSYFSRIATDYVERSPALRQFHEHDVCLEGIRNAIEKRKSFNTDRELLYHELREQYKIVHASGRVAENLERLRSADTFTVCTAHQPNIFTGHLYFIYKILHVIKLADRLNNEITNCHFVPVYYIGSEDADLDELGHIFINGDKHE